MDTPILYFAYGSNLDSRDRGTWFRGQGLRDPLRTPLGRAYLPDFELVFHYHSNSRGGGALDIRPRRGQATAGMLYRVDEEELHALDRKEGAPTFYRRVKVSALAGDGTRMEAITYRALPGRTSDGFVQPTPEYVEIVRRGMRQHGIDTALLDAVATNLPAPWTVPAVFVYGTLLRGEIRHGLLRKASEVECALLATAPGRLFDLDEHPALVPCAEPDARVHGEFVRVADIGQTLERLDEIEGFTGYDPDSLYERVLIEPDLCSGRLRLAWAYVMRRAPEGAAPIESGCWRASRGRRQEFYRRLVAAHAMSDLHELARRIATGYPWALSPNREEALEAVLVALEDGEVPEFRLAQSSGEWTVLGT